VVAAAAAEVGVVNFDPTELAVLAWRECRLERLLRMQKKHTGNTQNKKPKPKTKTKNKIKKVNLASMSFMTALWSF